MRKCLVFATKPCKHQTICDRMKQHSSLEPLRPNGSYNNFTAVGLRGSAD